MGHIPDRWTGLLGLVPFALGVKALVQAVRDGDSGDVAVVAGGALPVAAITVANGADNVAVYTPVFRTIGPGASVLTVAVFAAGVALWCLAGAWLGSHRSACACCR
ncbi:cadmium resistance transporter [Nonomuraea sp. LPB2021202275-12-8]|uniref:cadmium resistance transporter n=1 Tax=Nonomuraea sp. LPB2021202275-12-8 TaxID=3120159 RepID=UPI00300CFCD4